MTFANLKADPEYIRDNNSEELPAEKFTDEDLQDLSYNSAKQALELDLLAALQLDEEDENGILDQVTDLNTKRLQVALANKQLEIYYLNNDRGDGAKYNYYQRQYNQSRASFSTLRTGRTAAVGVSIQTFER